MGPCNGIVVAESNRAGRLFTELIVFCQGHPIFVCSSLRYHSTPLNIIVYCLYVTLHVLLIQLAS